MRSHLKNCFRSAGSLFMFYLLVGANLLSCHKSPPVLSQVHGAASLSPATDAMADEKGRLHWTWFTTTDGLISNDVRSMMVSKSGEIWILFSNEGAFSARYGISIYNGTTFENRTGEELDRITAMSQDQRGVVWYGFFEVGKGIMRQEGEHWRRLNQRQGLINEGVLCLFHDSGNNLWIGTFDGLSRYDGERFENFTVTNGLPHNFIHTITEDREGHIWIGTSGGACQFDGTRITTISKEDGLADNRVHSILQDQQGNLWFGTLGGLSFYDGNTIKNLTKEDGLPDHHISCMVQDDAGILWIGTHRGLSRYDGKQFVNYRARDAQGIDGGLIDDEITSIIQARDGSLWIGTRKGVCKLTHR